MKIGLNYIFPYGKYRGLTTEEVVSEEFDGDYVVWFVYNVLKSELTKKLGDFIYEQNNSGFGGGDMMSGSIYEGWEY